MDLINPMLAHDTLPSADSLRGLRPGNKPDQLREACEGAEGLFASILLKEGLKPVLDEAGEGESHAGALLEYSIEELARDMGRQGLLGIADQFYAQMSGGAAPRPTPKQGDTP